MNLRISSRPPRSIFWAALTLTASPAALLAQVAPPVQATSANNPGATPAPEDIVVLSPFSVKVSQDRGFVAADSLAGGRISSALKDTPAAYSVLTRDFIDALNLVDLNDASAWVVNSTSTQTNGTTEITNGSTLAAGFRGFGSNTPERDFFPFAVNFDSYDIERYDFARGPNAILFGNGEFSGTINAVTRQAQTDRSFGETRTTYGSWDNLRNTIDLNAAAPGNAFALRVDALYADRAGWRDYEMDRRKAASIEATWKISPQTALRFQAEDGFNTRNNPLTNIDDHFAGWDGKTTFSAPVLTLPANAGALGITRYGSSTSPVFAFSPGWGTQPINIANSAETTGALATATTPIAGTIGVGALTNVNTWPVLPSQGLPAGEFANAIAGSSFRPPNRTFATSTDLPTFVQDYHSFSGFLTEEVNKNLYVELDGNYSREQHATQFGSTRNLLQTYIDINQNLPSGAPNPEFLRPYNEETHEQFTVATEDRNVRLFAAYLLDNTPLGSHHLNVGGGTSSLQSALMPKVYVVKLNSDPRKWPNTNPVDYRYYWNEQDRPVPDVPSVTYNGITYPTGWVSDITNPAYGGISNTQLTYVQAALNSSFWKDRIHTLFAVRHDSYDGSSKVGQPVGDYNANWDGTTFYYAPPAPPDYFNLTYVPKDANGNPTGPAQQATARPRDASGNRLPQYANDRFQNDYSPPAVKVKVTTFSAGSVVDILPWLSGYYNYATTFNPNPARQLIDGTLAPPEKAGEWDAGLRVTLPDGRLSLSLSTYKGSENGQVFDPSSLNVAANLNAIISASPVGASASGQGNSRGLPQVPIQFFDQRNLADSGYEFELVANPLRGWRVLANAALPHAYQTNAYSGIRNYLAKNAATIKQILTDDGVVIDPSTHLASVDQTVLAAQRSPDAATAAAGYNSIQSAVANMVTGSQIATRLTLFSANFFTDYTLPEGLLRGLKAGAGINFRGKQVIGYHGADTISNPANPAVAIAAPNASPYSAVYDKGYYTVTSSLGYTVHVGRHVTSYVELRVDNLLNYSRPIYYDTLQRAPNGDYSTSARIASPADFYYVTPRNYTLSANFKF